MIKLIILILSVFMGGCVGNALTHKTYNPDGSLQSVIEIKNLNGFVNTETGMLVFEVEDGEFKVRVVLLDRTLTDSPESATAILDGLSNLSTGGASGLVKKVME